MEITKFINECKENVLSGVGISSEDISKLFEIPEDYVQKLGDAANQITREFNGNKVDVEQLNNIKKILAAKIVLFVANLHFLKQELNHINYLQLRKLSLEHKKPKMKGQNHIA